MSVRTFAVDLKTENQYIVFNRLHSKVNIMYPIISFPTNSVFLWYSYKGKMPLS